MLSINVSHHSICNYRQKRSPVFISLHRLHCDGKVLDEIATRKLNLGIFSMIFFIDIFIAIVIDQLFQKTKVSFVRLCVNRTTVALVRVTTIASLVLISNWSIANVLPTAPLTTACSIRKKESEGIWNVGHATTVAMGAALETYVANNGSSDIECASYSLYK